MVKNKTLVHRGRDGEPDVYNFTISNIHGHENGDTTLDKIYGRVIAVSKWAWLKAEHIVQTMLEIHGSPSVPWAERFMFCVQCTE